MVFGLLGVLAGLVLPVAAAARPVAAPSSPVALSPATDFRTADDLTRAAPASRASDAEARSVHPPVPAYLAAASADRSVVVFMAVVVVMAAVAVAAVRPAAARAPPLFRSVS